MKTLADIQKELEQVGLHSRSGIISVALHPMVLYTVSSSMQINRNGQAPTYSETWKDCELGRGIYNRHHFYAMRPFTPYGFERWNGLWFLFNRDYVPFNPNAGLQDEHPVIRLLKLAKWNRQDDNKLFFFIDGTAPWCGRDHLVRLLRVFDGYLFEDQKYRAWAEVTQ